MACSLLFCASVAPSPGSEIALTERPSECYTTRTVTSRMEARNHECFRMGKSGCTDVGMLRSNQELRDAAVCMEMEERSRQWLVSMTNGA
jgi:hypothetical protein